MKRYQMIKDKAIKMLEEKSHGFYKREAYAHMFQVETLCVLLARKRNLNQELASIIGLLHDIAIPLTMNSFDHANRSSMISKELLMSSKQFNEEEINLIVHAISCHSNKSIIEDDYCELIKDADVFSHSLEGQLLKEEENKRLSHIEL